MNKILIHPNMLTHLSSFYSDTCTIEYYTAENPDEFGQPQPTWINFPSHVSLDCAIAPKGGREIKQPDMTIAISTHTIAIAGYYPTIIPWMRVVISGQIYDILLVEVDSHSIMTRLTVRVVG